MENIATDSMFKNINLSVGILDRFISCESTLFVHLSFILINEQIKYLLDQIYPETEEYLKINHYT
jgi:hypothetical protein